MKHLNKSLFDRSHASQYWEAMWQARQSCEKMSSRGVRATKDVMQAWSEITSDLTDRVERSEQQVSAVGSQQLQILALHC